MFTYESVSINTLNIFTNTIYMWLIHILNSCNNDFNVNHLKKFSRYQHNQNKLTLKSLELHASPCDLVLCTFKALRL